MTLSRRDFLKSGLMIAGSCYSWNQLSLLAAQAADAEPRKPGSGKILVLIQLAGGNDGLNTVIPYNNGTYYQVRPAIGVKQDKVLPLNGQIALNPAMKEMQSLFQQHKLAVILGLGYPQPNRSHFRSIEIWQTANPDKIIDTGWLGRYLDLASNGKQQPGNNLFPAVNVDPILPKTLSAQKVVVPSVYDLNQFRFATDSHYQQDHKCQIDAFNRLYSDFHQNPQMEIVKNVGIDALKASDYLTASVKSYKGTVTYPDSGFARSLKFIAQMICAGVNAKIYNVSLGGFDTHSGQVNTQTRLLQQLSQGIAAFQQDLESHGVDRDVLTMTFSEFGRRVSQNNGNGTDHGTAAPQFVIGTSIRGGVYGDYPSLTDLDAGDLKYKIDFRNVYATVLDRWLQADSRQILGAHYDDIGFVS